MSLLRIHASLADAPERCSWVLIDDGGEPVISEGRFADLPSHADRVQLILPASQVLLTRTRLPSGARRLANPVLAFALEEQIAGEPDSNHVSWLGKSGDEDVLSVVDKQGLQRWRDALEAIGIRVYDVHCETLMLPRQQTEWSMAWDGREGCLRTGPFEGAAMDGGNPATPPLSLRLMLESARKNATLPTGIAVYATTPDALPDIAQWQQQLDIPLRLAGRWSWHSAPVDAGVNLAQERQRWRSYSGIAARLRPAAWIVGVALVIHAIALVSDWMVLTSEQKSLRQNMETRFRTVFPDAIAVVDPALQMRRKLAEVRHAAGLPDSGDFLPMIDKAAAATKHLPADSVRIVSFESGRITIELRSNDPDAIRRAANSLLQSGLTVDPIVNSPKSSGGIVAITMRAS